jgi:hypothetical protein
MQEQEQDPLPSPNMGLQPLRPHSDQLMQPGLALREAQRAGLLAVWVGAGFIPARVCSQIAEPRGTSLGESVGC